MLSFLPSFSYAILIGSFWILFIYWLYLFTYLCVGFNGCDWFLQLSCFVLGKVQHQSEAASGVIFKTHLFIWGESEEVCGNGFYHSCGASQQWSSAGDRWLLHQRASEEVVSLSAHFALWGLCLQKPTPFDFVGSSWLFQQCLVFLIFLGNVWIFLSRFWSCHLFHIYCLFSSGNVLV